MVKQRDTLMLEPKHKKKLKEKAEAFGFVGRGWLNIFIAKVAQEDFIFIPKGYGAFLKKDY